MPRRHLRARATALALVVCAVATSAAAQADIQTVEFFSQSVGRPTKYNIVLPRSYATSERRYPVLYLLHGFGQNFQAWSRQGVGFYAPLFDMIIVMPDAGNSWYVNWPEDGTAQKQAWEDHIVGDVIGHVDATYRTLAQREGRAINGLSMGGFGSLAIGLRHPDLFVSIGSHSGALEYARSSARRLRERLPRRIPPSTAEQEARRRRQNPDVGLPGFSSQVERTPPGEPFRNEEEALAYDPFTLIGQVPEDERPHIYVDCGLDDPLVDAARDFAQVLLANDVPFDFMQKPGGHNPGYWTEAIGHSMSIQYEVMQRALGRRPVAVRPR